MIFILRLGAYNKLRSVTSCIAKISQPVRFQSNTLTRFHDYQLIYKYPLIRLSSIVNRLKLYQTIATATGIPGTVVLAISDFITTETAVVFAVTGIMWCLGFFMIGFLGQNRVGMIYLMDDQKTVKISYANTWGTKVDIEVDINDILPLSEISTNPILPYYSLQRYSTKDTLKFNLKYAIIEDPAKFKLIFGDNALAKKS
ncbi:transmembrane protein 186 [Neodiprion fabricii]|uniref:transmembrane protein 186 n=1 Tax=Neodiprion fabricii TaxID=2872261 RepID=UPI001ED92DAF|nr:transmembrane protein 186 [Neodiprion fabricii]